ncbi:hypothetical protein [Rhodoligotrophos ferricapiens]|uniref:hypothetical protein n=1 Tax=Rhodoligotrophos ferricapiens TaxID=3069264 RepID=UPI00315D32F8
MPIGYLDVPTAIDAKAKGALVRALYEALTEAYPFPDDHRIFIREWDANNASQNGSLGSEPARPVLFIHGPQGANVDAKRRMLTKLNAAVSDAYRLPDFMIFMHEYPLELVAHEGRLLADNQQRVEEQTKAYS